MGGLGEHRTECLAKSSTNHRNTSISNTFSGLSQAERCYVLKDTVEDSKEKECLSWMETFVSSLELLQCLDVVCSL